VNDTETTFVVVAALLVVFAGLFAGAEVALSRVSRLRVEQYVRERRAAAHRLQQVVRDPARYLNVLLLLRTFSEITATVLVSLVCLGLFGESWQAVLVAASIMLVVSYVVIGVSPRTLGRQHADRIALLAASPTWWLARVLRPITFLLILVGNALTPGKGFREGPFTSEAELRDLVDLAEERALIEDDERQMIHSVFELGDTIVREVMVPRTDMVFIERTKTLRQAISLALRSGFSRIPVIGENLDDVLGIAYLKDLVRRTYEFHEGESTERVESVMRPPTFVPDSKPVDDVLREMQGNQVHLAIVVDEYGGTAGLVTIEDILEEIVGEIADEYDREVPPIEFLPEGAYRVTARLSVEELAELTGREIQDDDVDTVGGLLAKHLGRVPIPGAAADVAGLRLVAEMAEGRRNRIGTILVTPADGSAPLPTADAGPRRRRNGTADVAAPHPEQRVDA
jgi:CBS domain containing-hemolysin-like protein